MGVLCTTKLERSSAQGGTRTLTALRPQHFECCAYTIPPPELLVVLNRIDSINILR